MQNIKNIFFIGIIVLALGCSNAKNDKSENTESSFFEQVEQIPDSIVVGDVVVYNLFKHQILAHKNDSFDSVMIVKNVYERHKKIWTELYTVLFDKQMFSAESGMIDWNKRIFKEKRDSIESRVRRLISARFSEKLKSCNYSGIKSLI